MFRSNRKQMCYWLGCLGAEPSLILDAGKAIYFSQFLYYFLTEA